MPYEENLKIREELFAGRVPKRLFIRPVFTLEAACGLAGVDLKRAHYEPELKNKAMRAVCDTFYSDTFPIENVRFPAVYQTLKAKNWVMSSMGMLQHPEIESFKPDDYDEYIENPLKVIMEKVVPEICEGLNTDRMSASITMTKAYFLFLQTAMQEGAFAMEISKEKGYVQWFHPGLIVEAPFDFLSDQLRGFKGITIDVRRIPDKVEAAVNATLPLMLRQAIPRNVQKGMVAFIPLHLAPYLRMKDFDRLYWPTFEKLITEMHKNGVQAFLFAEEDWTRYAEYLRRLPANTIIQFEKGDLKRVKDVIGDKHIIGGYFDPTITLTRTKEECIDEVKRLVDVGACGGRFYFGFDRHVMDIKSINISNLQAVLEWVRDNTDY